MEQSSFPSQIPFWPSDSPSLARSSIERDKVGENQYKWYVYPGRASTNAGNPEAFGFDFQAPITWLDCSAGLTGYCNRIKAQHIRHAVSYQQVSDLIDMDGDLLPDRVIAEGGGTDGDTGLRVFRNTGSGFGQEELWDAPADPELPWIMPRPHIGPPWESPLVGDNGVYWPLPVMNRLLADLNGDGRPDYYSMWAGNLGKFTENAGSGFGTWSSARLDNVHHYPDPPGGDLLGFSMAFYGYPGSHNHLLDVNGDGIPDFGENWVCLTDSGWVEFGLGFSRGGDALWQREAGSGHERGYVEAPPCPDLPVVPNTVINVSDFIWHRFPEAGHQSEQVTVSSMHDMNGDGLRDYVISSDQTNGLEVYLALGEADNE